MSVVAIAMLGLLDVAIWSCNGWATGTVSFGCVEIG